MTPDTYKKALHATHAWMQMHPAATPAQIEEAAAGILSPHMTMEEALDGALQVATDLIAVAGTPEQQRAAFSDSPEAHPVRVVWGSTFPLAEPVEGETEDSGVTERIMMIEADSPDEQWEAAERCAQLACELAGETYSEVFEVDRQEGWGEPDPEPATACTAESITMDGIRSAQAALVDGARDFASLAELAGKGVLTREQAAELWNRTAAKVADALALN